MTKKTYVAIDLKSFYASVECVERQLDPLNTNLVVADESRTEKIIVLAAYLSIMSEFEPHKTKNRHDKNRRGGALPPRHSTCGYHHNIAHRVFPLQAPYP